MREELFILHFKNYTYINTYSEGEEPFRRVVVELKKDYRRKPKGFLFKFITKFYKFKKKIYLI